MSDDLTRIKPALGRLVCKLMTTDGVSKGGIILPGGRQEITSIGEVVAVCEPYRSAEDDTDDAQRGPLYAIGDKIIFGKYSGTEVSIDRDKFVIMKESDVLATLHAQEE